MREAPAQEVPHDDSPTPGDPWTSTNFAYAGKWDVPSACGLRVVQRGGSLLAVATELYDKNPGTSVTEMATAVRAAIAEAHGVGVAEVTLVVRCPSRGSKLACYGESFDRYVPEAGAGRWERIEKDEVEGWFIRG